MKWVFLTLTMKNVEGHELKNTMDQMTKVWNRFSGYAKFKQSVKGYFRAMEVTRNRKYTSENYGTYHPHFHVILAVNKSYFTSRDYLKQDKWLEMWRECMDDLSITQVDIRKVRSSEKSENGAVLEVAKYSAKSNELYASQSIFEIFYRALKGRQLLTFNGLFKEYVKKYKQGELDQYKKEDENEYTHLLTSVWKTSKYDNMLRQLTVEEFEEYNSRAKEIEIG